MRWPMQLSKRLREIGNLVIPGSRVADIGCDHAYTSIYLIKKNISPYVIAMDINKGPLERARMNIEDYGYMDKIELRQSDGIKEIKEGEVDTLLIAGMGGGLMLKILSEGRDIIRSDIESLILQPQSDISLVRRQLKDFGFLIVYENMIKEDGKYYPMMRAEKESKIEDKEAYDLTKEEHYNFGRLLLEGKHKVLEEYLIKKRRQLEKINNNLMANPTKRAALRQEEILSMTKLIDSSLKYFY